MYIQIKKAELVPDTRWHHIKITMVGLYDNDWKYVKRIKLDDALLNDLLATKIQPWLFNPLQNQDDWNL